MSRNSVRPSTLEQSQTHPAAELSPPGQHRPAAEHLRQLKPLHIELFPELCEARKIPHSSPKDFAGPKRNPEVSTASITPATDRWRALDVLRGVAIVLVLGPHTPFRFSQQNLASRTLTVWRETGWVGVDIFFVLSGFLIAGLLFSELKKNGQLNLRRFFVRRFIKIWPAYLVYLLVIFVTQSMSHSGSLLQRMSATTGEIWPFLIHIQNYYFSPLVERMGHCWSLAVEEHFYILLPTMVFLLLNIKRFPVGQKRVPARLQVGSDKVSPQLAYIPWICGGFSVVCLALRIIAWHNYNQFDEFIHHWPTHLRLDSMFAGVALAYLVHFKREYLLELADIKNYLIVFGILCLLPFCAVSYQARPTCTIGYSLLQLGGFALVLSAWLHSLRAPRKKNILSRISGSMSWVGRRSYSIYLWHMPFATPIVTRLLSRVGLWNSPAHDVIAMVIYAGVCITLGAVMYALVEAPVMALREKWAPSVSGSLTIANQNAIVERQPADVADEVDTARSILFGTKGNEAKLPVRRAI